MRLPVQALLCRTWFNEPLDWKLALGLTVESAVTAFKRATKGETSRRDANTIFRVNVNPQTDYLHVARDY